MISNLNILIPEIFLSISIFIILMVGVFVNKSYNFVTNLSYISIIILIFVILNDDSISTKIFSESFIRDSFADFIKVLILLGSIFVLFMSRSSIICTLFVMTHVNLMLCACMCVL